jgi:SOS-response transcriptional repressor LexA
MGMLSERQYNVLQFIYQHTPEHHFAPTLREIGCAVGITSTSVVNYNVERLVRLGYLVKATGKSRAFTLTEIALELFEGSRQAETDTRRLRDENRLLRAENERLRREHKTEVAALRRELLHLVQELKLLRQTAEVYPA